MYSWTLETYFCNQIIYIIEEYIFDHANHHSIQYINPKIVKKHEDIIDWIMLCDIDYLDANFMFDFQDKLDWKQISKNQWFNEEIVRMLDNKLNFNNVSKTHCELIVLNNGNYTLLNCDFCWSDEFLNDYKDKLNWKYVQQNCNLRKETKIKFKNYIQTFKKSL
jgi:hypothetical protein